MVYSNAYYLIINIPGFGEYARQEQIPSARKALAEIKKLKRKYNFSIRIKHRKGKCAREISISELEELCGR